ncbi:MAG: hypothetical protein PHO37_15045 [Kiritimatiellae bacterium]|nr:hypothetical protein [Kiritimatiellia bacterium]
MKKSSIPRFNPQTPSHRTALLVGVGLVLNAALIGFMILPLKKRMAECLRESNESVSANERMSAVVRSTNEKRESVAELQARYDTSRERGVLTPLLNSYAMRAKRLVQPCAQQSGLEIENAIELASIPLQQPQPLENSAFCRQPIEFTATGSYAQLTAFIAAMEAEHPMSILYALKISAQQRTPEIHKIQICYEWPAKIAGSSEQRTSTKP